MNNENRKVSSADNKIKSFNTSHKNNLGLISNTTKNSQISNPTDQQAKRKKLTMIWHIEQLLKISKDCIDMDEVQKNAKRNIKIISLKLKITPAQAVVFSCMVEQASYNRIRPNELQESLHCTKIQIVMHLNDLDDLESRGLISSETDQGKKYYQVLPAVVNALQRGMPIRIRTKTNLTIYHFFDELEKFMKKLICKEVALDQYIKELKLLIGNNMHLAICKALISFRLPVDFLVVLSVFCVFHFKYRDEDIDKYDISRVFSDSYKYHTTWRDMISHNNPLFKKNLIENVTNSNFSDSEEFTLSEKAKNKLLSEIDFTIINAKMKKGLIPSQEITEKIMFYNEKEEKSILELGALLQPNNFMAIQKRLKQKSMRNGFACLFYGEPGTGKTETASQIARMTGRDIMLVDISEIKSCWFGESEKRIKKVFDKYRQYVKTNNPVPILLFNEADAVISKRININAKNTAQTENSIQNIILQEMETLDGIMIATTNLIGNLDPAFERRFLYKIEFEKPSLKVRKAIWKAHLPELGNKDAEILASSYDFSGGQIENIARKRMVDSIIHGGKINIETIREYCINEKLSRDQKAVIGFNA